MLESHRELSPANAAPAGPSVTVAGTCLTSDGLADKTLAARKTMSSRRLMNRNLEHARRAVVGDVVRVP
ncbi:hypothetical protein [Nocardia sp. NRRL S-836]|uniref:hypothetical protein n=1 Tax=Nocardia sp. NRRL S-836 TaxID=1519492 RepID=UPI0006AD86AD|nr:hypothetical protein [Nocardia sp. NRRL S-836]KOV84147.1 hypothetical protein ADL03_18065 [Nocardia sp. NRRL S-836]